MIRSSWRTLMTARFFTFKSTATVTRCGFCFLSRTFSALTSLIWEKWNSALSSLLAQDQFWALLFPPGFHAPLLKIAAVLHGIVGPGPLLPRIHFEPDKARAQIQVF